MVGAESSRAGDGIFIDRTAGQFVGAWHEHKNNKSGGRLEYN